MGNFLCKIGLHYFIGLSVSTTTRDSQGDRFLGYTVTERCDICGKIREKYYRKGYITFSKSRTHRNKIRADRKINPEEFAP